MPGLGVPDCQHPVHVQQAAVESKAELEAALAGTDMVFVTVSSCCATSSTCKLAVIALWQPARLCQLL